jgi:hypothetical protein
LETRLKWQRASWLSNIDSYIVLTGSIGSIDPKVACMNVGDNYESCPYRYYQYIKENDLASYDWIVFVDDDTFVFPKRLEAYLATLDNSLELYVGHILTYPITFMSGGAGFCLTKTAYKSLRDYLLNTHRKQIRFEINGDVTMGVWINLIPNIKLINSNKFNGSPHMHHKSTKTDVAITYHYVTEELFKTYGLLLDT